LPQNCGKIFDFKKNATRSIAKKEVKKKMPQKNMKKSANIRDVLGVTQEEMAMLLKITRSQLSMYELGKRDLPADAKIKVAEMLQHVQESGSKSTANLPIVKAQERKKENRVAELLLDNKYKQLVLDKKIKAVEKKYAANLTAIRLAGYLENQTIKNPTQENQLLNGIKAKALTEIDKNGLHILFEYQIKKEVLEFEEKLLEKFSRKL
jgi:transcriptional regulator with XRE-family HTH domain